MQLQRTGAMCSTPCQASSLNRVYPPTAETSLTPYPPLKFNCTATGPSRPAALHAGWVLRADVVPP